MLTTPKTFFDKMRDGLLGPTLETNEVSGCNAIMDAAAGLPVAWAAYMLATAYLETAHSMQPVMEANWLSKVAAERYFFRMYDRKGARPHVAATLGNVQDGDGVRFAGRGYPQMTGRANYAKADKKLGLNGALLADPNLAMKPEIAAKIMRFGMTEGWFTGKKLETYLPAPGRAGPVQFKQARRIINGQDRADDVARYAVQFQEALIAGGWKA